MSRKTRKSTFYIWILLAGLSVAAVGVFAVQQVNEPYRTVSPLSVSDYSDNSLALHGNTYKVKGGIDNLLKWSEVSGRLVSVRTKQGPVAVIFPAAFSADNLQKGMQIVALVTVGDKGLLQVASWQKQ
ncbi:hypothetical protein BH09VER1_BH09VER1_26510 [soil metagenome]